MIESRSSGGIFDIEKKQESIQNLEKQSSESTFWNDNERAQSVLKEMTALKEWTSTWENLQRQQNEVALLLDLAEEENDEETFGEVSAGIDKLVGKIEQLELRRMLGGEDDL